MTVPDVEMARALVAQGNLLAELHDSESAIAVYDEVVEHFGRATEPEVLDRVGRALCNKGLELVDLGRSDEAIAVYEDVLDRLGDRSDPELREVIADALYNKGCALEELGRSESAIVGFDALLARFADASEPAIREDVARALLSKAVCLDDLGRHEQEIEVYDELVGRFGDDAELEVREQVAWALFDKAFTLSDLGRHAEAGFVCDDLIARFGQATEPTLRGRVSWAFVRKIVRLAELNETDEAGRLVDELLARDADALDPELRDNVAWALLHRSAQFDEEGRTEDELVLLDDLIERFGDDTELELRDRVATALLSKAQTLGRLGRHRHQLATYQDVIDRFDAAGDLQLRVADALGGKAHALEQLGRLDDALAAYDEELATIGTTAEPARQQRAGALLDKGLLLSHMNRRDEAVVVFDSVASTCRANGGADDSQVTPAHLEKAVRALLYKLTALCELNWMDELLGVREQLVELLGDLAEPRRANVVPHHAVAPDSESALAELLAQTHSGDCWLLFATGGRDQGSREFLAERALELYRLTTPWMETDLAEWDKPAFAAATTLRGVADGFAILSRRWSEERLAQLALPNRPVNEWTIRLFGVDEWASELGHPLDLRESLDTVEALVDDQRAKGEDSSWRSALASHFVMSLGSYELLTLLCRSEKGRDALRTDGLRNFATWLLSESRSAAGWTWQHLDEATSAGAAMIFIAQAFFIASREHDPSGVQPFPSRQLLGGLLESGAYHWLAGEDVELPAWLHYESE